MKLTTYLAGFAIALVMFSSCKKDDDQDGNPDGYYFRANVNGQEFLFESQSLQSGSSFMAHFGGYVPSVNSLFIAGGLFIEVNPSTSPPSEADILALVGDTIMVDEDNWPHAIVQFDAATASQEYTTQGFDHTQTGYVILTEIDPLGPDDTDNWNVYAVRGTFKANVEYYDGNNSSDAGEATGDFFMRLTTNK